MKGRPAVSSYVAGAALAAVLGTAYLYHKPLTVSPPSPSPVRVTSAKEPVATSAVAKAALAALAAGGAYIFRRRPPKESPWRRPDEFDRYPTYGDGNCMFVCLFVLHHHLTTGEWVDPARRTGVTQAGAERMRQLATASLEATVERDPGWGMQITAMHHTSPQAYLAGMRRSAYGDYFALVAWQMATKVGVQAYEAVGGRYMLAGEPLYPPRIHILSTSPGTAGHFDVLLPKLSVR